jgi:succinate dehydrogenase / fumarate reductase cytochrome b subunit
MDSHIFRKSIVALTGLFLCLFLLVHLSANCLLLLPESLARTAYNSYSTALRQSPFVNLIAYVLYFSLLMHAVFALLLTIRNRRAKPKAYVRNMTSENSSWASQNMGLLGLTILLFLVVHLANFWARIKLGLGEVVPLDAFGNKDVYELTYSLFQNAYVVTFYTLIALPLGFHVHHGLKSAFASLGFYHEKGLKVLSKISLIYAMVVGVGFGIIPLIVFFK